MFRSIIGCVALSTIVGCASPRSNSPSPSTPTTSAAAADRVSENDGVSCTFPSLREELLAMKVVDQAVRAGIVPSDVNLDELGGMQDVDARNTARMKEIVAEFGWPTSSLVGEDGARAAWLLVQHADLDPVFQRECLERMRSFGTHEVSPGDVAYLTDRVRVNESLPQVYGTQFHEVNGHHEPRPIENPDTVDARRAAAGLGTLAEYRELMGE